LTVSRPGRPTYLGINRNKRSIALDFADPGRGGPRLQARHPGRHRHRHFRHGGLNWFGLDCETVTEGRPRAQRHTLTAVGRTQAQIAASLWFGERFDARREQSESCCPFPCSERWRQRQAWSPSSRSRSTDLDHLLSSS